MKSNMIYITSTSINKGSAKLCSYKSGQNSERSVAAKKFEPSQEGVDKGDRMNIIVTSNRIVKMKRNETTNHTTHSSSGQSTSALFVSASPDPKRRDAHE